MELCIHRMSLVAHKTQCHMWFNDANLKKKKKKECFLREFLSDYYVDQCSLHSIYHLDSVKCVNTLTGSSIPALAIPHLPAHSPSLVT